MSIRTRAVRCRSGAVKGERCRSSRGSDAAGLVQSAKASALSLQSDLLWRAICVSVTHALALCLYYSTQKAGFQAGFCYIHGDAGQK